MSRRVLALIQKLSHRFSIFDLATSEEILRIQLPDFPHEMVVDREGKFAYVGHYGVETSGHTGDGGHKVIAIDLAKGAVSHEIDCWPYYRIHGLLLDNAGRLYALSERDNTLLVIDDPSSQTSPSSAVPVGGIKPHLMAVTRDGATAICANILSHTITRVAPHDATVVPVAINMGRKPEGLAFSHDEKQVFVTSRVSATLSRVAVDTMKIEAQAKTRGDTNRVYLDRSGRLVLCNFEDKSITLADTESLEETFHHDLGHSPVALSLDPDLPVAHVSTLANEVVSIDLDARCIVGVLRDTGVEPDVSQVLIV